MVEKKNVGKKNLQKLARHAHVTGSSLAEKSTRNTRDTRDENKNTIDVYLICINIMNARREVCECRRIWREGRENV